MIVRSPRDGTECSAAPAQVFDLSLGGTAHAVRNALATSRAHLSTVIFDHSALDQIELVMAETLNNIVEHALAGHSGGNPISVSCTIKGDTLSLVFQDSGAPFFGRNLHRPTVEGAPTDLGSLPEGGFGWRLIHSLTHSVSYRRSDRLNKLTIIMRLGTNLDNKALQ